MKFGFLAHAVGAGQRNLVRSAGLIMDVLSDRSGWPTVPLMRASMGLPMVRRVRSAAGAHCTGDVRVLPYVAEDILRHHVTAVDVITEQVSELADGGAAIVGLGGATSIVGDRGRWVAERTGIAVTSGNSLTVYAAHETLRRVLSAAGNEPGDTPVAVIGYPGSIGLAISRLLLADGHRVDLVHRRRSGAEATLLRALDPQTLDRVRLLTDVADAYADRVIVGASSTGGILDPDRLLPGSVVVDVALPRDVRHAPRGRDDVLILDGGLVCADEAISFDGRAAAPTRLINGCLAETVVLALEGRAESWSIGRELPPERVSQIGEMSRRHGLAPAPPSSYGRAVRDEELHAVASLGRRTSGCTVFDRSGRAVRDSPEPIAALTAARYRRHVNPALAELLEGHGINHVFTSAEACTLRTAEGVEYLDFVAGYGCLNLGHNPPSVIARLHGFLDSAAPTFVQYVSMPVHTSELAERLCEVAPGRLARVFFSNSGTEAVEAALKVARAATGRTGLVHVDNSYHGKTLGALSVTGRASHRTPFAPLLDGCVSVPYGDIAALESALDGAAAFVVEPVLGEGGVVVPPDGYLRRAQELCRARGAVFIVDEVQTGLGRTGALFASEHWGLEPDVLCLAKSLSGGLVPIGATLVTADVWDAAYGSTSRAALHSSTFGGGNFAAAAGLATLDAIEEQDLPARAAKLGQLLRSGLIEVCERYSFIREVRGIGLMNAIAFDADFSGALGAAVDDALTRLPGDLHQLADLISDDTREALVRAGRSIESTLGDLLCLRFVRGMARDHRVLTFVAANQTRVLRVQPPLILQEHEATRFVEAVDGVARSLAFYSDLAAR